jgi:3,4-dihydroxyphenylacetate 2,3-dioxygenase
MGSLAGVFLSVHTPRYCTLEAAFEGRLASEVFRPVRDGLVAQGRDVAEARLDLIAVNSCHLITTFPTVIDGTPRHQGVLTAQEAPEIIHGVRYDYPGDYAFASTLATRGKAEGRQTVLANDVHYPLDYGTVMPMVCYLDRAQRLPLVPISVCLAANLDECFAWGRTLARVAREGAQRVGFVASGSVSHKLVRGPFSGPRTRRSTTSLRGSSPAATTTSSGAGCPATWRAWRPRWVVGTWP